jgi:class 3 adenylate cyclase
VGDPPGGNGQALARHEALIAEAVAAHGGRLVKSRGEGDSTFSVFVRASDAVAAALAIQRALAGERWPDGITLPTRIALHSGEAELRGGDYYGQALNRAARLRALAQGGNVLLSQGTAELVMDQLPPATTLASSPWWQVRPASASRHWSSGSPSGTRPMRGSWWAPATRCSPLARSARCTTSPGRPGAGSPSCWRRGRRGSSCSARS